MSNYIQINGQIFPYENSQYGDVDKRITGKMFWYSYSMDLPKAKVALMNQQGIISIEAMAEEKLLEVQPDYAELTYYGTRKKGYYRELRKQVHATMWWIFNKQPSWIILFVDKIDDTVTGNIKMLIQNGVNVQLSSPATGYSCIIEAVYNKKQEILFTKRFLCEKYDAEYNAVLDGQQEKFSDKLQEVLDVMGHGELVQKCISLLDYRRTVQDKIWELVNYTLAPYQEEWKIQNLDTLDTRVAFAIDAQTQDILDKYAIDFKLKPDQRLTIEDLKDPKFFSDMLSTISICGPAFGINVKTTESQPDSQTFMPVEWLRHKNSTSSLLKQAHRVMQSLRRAPLNELLTAYIQIDWYLDQPCPEAYYMDGYFTCAGCGKPIHNHVTEYRDLIDDERADYNVPVIVCDYCDQVHEEDVDTYDMVAYEPYMEVDFE